MPSSSAFERKLKREIASRKAAEALLEEKSLELFNANQKLEVALKQVEQRSEEGFRRLEFQQKVERLLIQFGRAFLRANLDDVLLTDLIYQINQISPDVCCSIAFKNNLIPTLKMSDYQKDSLLSSNEKVQQSSSRIEIEVEQKVVGTMTILLTSDTFPLEFVNSQMSLICELLASAITRQLINLKLVESKERAEASERSTREFLAMINHELRTPLNGLLGSVELLADTGLSESQKDLHHNLSQSGQLLRSIINDLLDFSKIDAGMLELIESDFSWPSLESTLKSIFEHKAVEKQIGFNISANNLANKKITGDLERITQIFVNLIGNAIKFTDKGQVDICVNNDAKGIVFSISDTGIGISEKAQAKLFQPFTQADRSSSRNYEGTGLGLAICKKLVELMGGKISLESTLGEGTKFTVYLRLKVVEVEDKAINHADEKSDAKDFSALNILVVDDIKMNIVIITKMLSKLGIKPDVAVNGLEAVEHASQQTYDLIFMDCRMPVMDGFEATKTLRDANYAKPIVALTAGTTSEERQTCFEVGMDDILSKPYTAKDLTEALAKWAS